MTSKERVFAALEHKDTDRPPIFPVITFVHAAKLINRKISEVVMNPALAYDALLKAWEIYGFDGFEVPALDEFPVFNEHLSVKLIENRKCLVDANGIPRYALDDPNDLQICLINAEKEYEQFLQEDYLTCDRLLETGYMEPVHKLIQKVNGRAFIAGHVPGQTMNSLVLQRGSINAMMDLYDYPEKVHKAFEYFTNKSIELGKAFLKTGVDALYIGDAWSSASVISPELFEEFCLPYYKKMTDTFHEMGTKVYLHICGNSEPILELMTQSGVDAIEPLDPLGGVRLDDALARVGRKVALKGGINTLTLLNGSVEEVRKETEECLDIFRDAKGYIFGTGDDIPRDTRVENVLAMCETVRNYKK